MKLDYIIRKAKVNDAKHILEFINIVAKESDNLTFGAGEFDVSLEKEINYIKKLEKEDNQIMLVAVIGEEIISTLSYSGGHRSRIRHCGEFGISVKKKYWNNGVGKAMINSMFDWAKTSKYCEKINLKVREDNETAIKLYKKMGFIQEGLIVNDMKINNEFVSSIFMGKMIDK